MVNEVACGCIMTFAFTVNEVARSVEVSPMKRVLDVLRQDLHLTGTKEGCGEGECGACSIILDGEAINSCLVPICQVQGSTIFTVEGLAQDGRLDPLQQAFLECGGAQCDLYARNADRRARSSTRTPSQRDESGSNAGNLCRTGYVKIIDALNKPQAGARTSAAGVTGPARYLKEKRPNG
jgi:carbon-monoxide dehydrogenase small subunit